jgi:hypothetical protein
MQYLKCDKPGCDHIEYHQKLDATMVNKQCPKCSTNLLTQRDWADFSAFNAVIDAANKATPAGPFIKVNVNVHEGVVKYS